MRSTEFDKKVWRALKLIPHGRVTTYKEIAKFIGKPKAARAVGNSCHKNPDAPRVPCHRAVKSDGQLGGYARGARKKIILLKKEGIEIEKDKIKDFKNRKYKFK
ncbi:MAG: Methylated-DNA/protein-cysteinemethyltransferase [Parcubacteria group bacterium GW2011_GWC2_42_12]|nr:MAG: Methylated-DNA/protein-cysteinemethyltransferase [Parcubacteria group bacterium GW2011_GWC2_42_12]